ncbi:DEAD/DEAH box helicase [Curvibacter sp. HBC28]|uniref:DEAD/DEAH box helicase n=1 Tax=Curvibacter microcysteis TaxID=3026419 RepID=A0ABT5MKI7_9BURK|nr:DEAD/DEAH box helicase [Curvibacter sp. HBC28]MDD0817092.1 DEAD/DEAH box helicase [Curvibacter sp. HBC28]
MPPLPPAALPGSDLPTAPVLRRPGLRTVRGQLTPRLTLQTLGRGDGLLGMCRDGVFGPRGDSVTVVWVDWLYEEAGQPLWSTPAARTVLNSRPLPTERLTDPQGQAVLLHRDLAAEAQAADRVRTLGLRPLPADTLQWRVPEAAEAALPGARAEQLWTLVQESDFADWWADEVPALQAEGWSVLLRPGFAHLSVPVEAWRVLVQPDTGELLGHEVAGPLGVREPEIAPLGLPPRQGAWFLSLGVDIDGETLDLAPLLADLLRRDARWLSADALFAIDDHALIALRAPGGRRIEAPAAPLKKIVAALLDLLTDPQRRPGPWRLSSWDLPRLEALQSPDLTRAADSAGAPDAASAPLVPWHVQGSEGLAAWVARLRQSGSPPPVAAPTGLGIALRPYQQQGLAWLQYLRAQGLHGVLADDMGLGKTAQAIAHLLTEAQAGRLDRPALVVLPTSLIFNWQAELARLAPDLKVLTLHGPQRSALFDQLAQHQVVLTSYALLWRDLARLRTQPWHLLILDEAQMVKNADSRSARALRQLEARHRLCLTGTPMENHLGELWSLFDFLMPGFLGSARHFQQHWRKPIEVNGESLRARLLAERLRPFILRRRKTEVARELPDKVEVTLPVTLEGAQRELYESVRVAADHLVRRVLHRQGIAGAQISILDALLKLRQVCCDPGLVPGLTLPPSMPSAKMEALAQLLPELVAEGRRVLVFSQFTGLLARAGETLDELGVAWLKLTGDTPPAQRGALVQAFQEGQAPVFLISLKAGGIGLNLTAADTVIHLDPWWNPAVEQQATDRAHRIGQTQTVFVYRLVVQGSIEERMLALQQRKARLTEGVLGEDGAQGLKFSPDELEGLLRPLAPGA